jgi:hypothetical protein
VRGFPRDTGRTCGSWTLRERIPRSLHVQCRSFLRTRLCQWLSLRMMAPLKTSQRSPRKFNDFESETPISILSRADDSAIDDDCSHSRRSRRANEPCCSVKQADCPKGILCSVRQRLMRPRRSSRFRRKLIRGQKYLAQTGGTSRTDPRKTAIGDRDGPRGTSLWPRAYLLPFRELVLGAGDNSADIEKDQAIALTAVALHESVRGAQRTT